MMNVMSLQSSPLLVRDVDSGTLGLLLRFMYSGRVDVTGINPARIMKLLTAADLYQVELVREGEGQNGEVTLQPQQAGKSFLWKRVRHCVVFGVKKKEEK